MNNVLTGMQERVIGIERNVGHMTAAVNNLTQTMMNIQSQMTTILPNAFCFPLEPTYLTVPQPPAPMMSLPRPPALQQLTFKYNDGQESDGMDTAETTKRKRHFDSGEGIASDASDGESRL